MPCPWANRSGSATTGQANRRTRPSKRCARNRGRRTKGRSSARPITSYPEERKKRQAHRQHRNREWTFDRAMGRSRFEAQFSPVSGEELRSCDGCRRRRRRRPEGHDRLLTRPGRACTEWELVPRLPIFSGPCGPAYGGCHLGEVWKSRSSKEKVTARGRRYGTRLAGLPLASSALVVLRGARLSRPPAR
jgi:hypothetical protein